MSLGLAPFPSTHWSLVGLAGADDALVRRQALTRLLERYMEPLRTRLVVRRRFDPNRADDLLQSFLVSKVLEQDLFQRAVREKGRFRTFVATALDRFVANQLDKKDEQPPQQPLQGSASGEFFEMVDPAPGPDAAFELAWARQVLDEALRRMRDHCRDTAREDLWGIFEARVLVATLGQGEVIAYERLVERFELDSIAQAMNLLATGKRTFARALRSVIAEYERDATQIDSEIAELQAILSRGGNGGA